MADYLDQVFGPGGYLARAFPGYEARTGQVELARAVDRSFREARHLIGEGPCGTGKGYAYGVPAIYHASKGRELAQLEETEADPSDEDHVEDNPDRVVIATANIALQEQLVAKDLPTLKKILPWPFTFALLKGRHHYVCEDKLRESQAKGLWPGSGFFDGTYPQQVIQIGKWISKTKTGDESELPFIPEPKHWGLVAVTSEDCLGSDCKFRKDCFSEKAKKQAKAADIIVTNFHLLLAHLASPNPVLPPFQHLIVDEAHDLADVAREFFGFTRGEMSLKQMANKAKQWGRTELAAKLENEAGRFFEDVYTFSSLPAYEIPKRIKPNVMADFANPERLEAAIRDFAIVAEERLDNDLLPKRELRDAGKWLERSMKASADISEAVAALNDASVFYIEKDHAMRPKLCSRVIDVAPILSHRMFGDITNVCLVSATLTTNENFEFIKGEVGLKSHDPIEVIAATPFNFSEQALLVLPDMPDPKSEKFNDEATRVLDRVITHFNGRTLGLFTSFRTLKAVAERIREHGKTVLVQGEQPRSELARIFREDVSSVLFGTSSFWTGIDVPGESLSAVVIDKLPFPNPDDPIVNAICSRDPKGSFFTYMIPKATIQLRQGVGRLIRAKKDTGIVVILDNRLKTRRYGRMFLRSLPEMRRTSDLGNIVPFMKEANEWVNAA